MIDIPAIKSIARHATAEARKKHMLPYTVTEEDLADWREQYDSGTDFELPFPFIGPHIPKGYKQVDEYFCDSSGFGADDEPALSLRQLLAKLESGFAYAILVAALFQVWLGKFEIVMNNK